MRSWLSRLIRETNELEVLHPAKLHRCFPLLFPCCSPQRQTYHHSTQSHDPADPPQPLRPHFRRAISFRSRWFSPVLAGMGLYGHVIPAHADYFRPFPEARSPTGGAPLAHTGKEQRAKNHHSMGPVGCLCVLINPRIGLPFLLVSRPALADDSLPSLRLRWLSDHPLGHEREYVRLSHR